MVVVMTIINMVLVLVLVLLPLLLLLLSLSRCCIDEEDDVVCDDMVMIVRTVMLKNIAMTMVLATSVTIR